MDELKSLEQEAQRKIGRNIINFQHIEFMLKYLISRSNVHGKMSDLKDILTKRESDVHKKSLGLLAKDLFNNVYAERETMVPPDNLEEPWISFSFRPETNDSTIEKYKLELENLIDQRNELIHHRLHSINKKSHDSWRELIVFLDNQRDETIPIFDLLKSLGLSMIEASNELAKSNIR